MKKKRGQYFDLPLFFNTLLAPGGLSAECVQVSVILTWGLQGAGSESPIPKATILSYLFSY